MTTPLLPLPHATATLGDSTKHLVEIITQEELSFYIVRRVDNLQVLRVHKDNLKFHPQNNDSNKHSLI